MHDCREPLLCPYGRVESGREVGRWDLTRRRTAIHSGAGAGSNPERSAAAWFNFASRVARDRSIQSFPPYSLPLPLYEPCTSSRRPKTARFPATLTPSDLCHTPQIEARSHRTQSGWSTISHCQPPFRIRSRILLRTIMPPPPRRVPAPSQFYYAVPQSPQSPSGSRSYQPGQPPQPPVFGQPQPRASTSALNAKNDTTQGVATGHIGGGYGPYSVRLCCSPSNGRLRVSLRVPVLPSSGYQSVDHTSGSQTLRRLSACSDVHILLSI